MYNVSIVILNWNGEGFLRECIPSVIEAAGRYKKDVEIIVVDNGSADRSLDYLRSLGNRVRDIPLPENLGFSKAMNIGIKESRYNIVIGLNNDTVVDEDFIEPLVSHFADEKIFAIGAKMLHWDRKTLNFGKAIGSFKLGLFRRELRDATGSVPSLYACGGGFAVNKRKFLALGGFDEDMPAYWEDADLSYRAWKRGWKTLYEPHSIIYHRFHGTNLREYGEEWIQASSGESYFYFIWKNIHDKTLLWQQIFFLPALIPVAIATGRFYFIKGLFRAINRLPLIIEKRRREMEKGEKDESLTDRQILSSVLRGYGIEPL